MFPTKYLLLPLCRVSLRYRGLLGKQESHLQVCLLHDKNLLKKLNSHTGMLIQYAGASKIPNKFEPVSNYKVASLEKQDDHYNRLIWFLSSTKTLEEIQ
ncbi:hypothetical protein VNO77_20817 [Canavalia gladiata]|uniref:Uncharacterized protein n=1 Tax=Canavalia gladiata TaxID=3824 RepID=A0AAN9LTV9_CANGL